MRNAHGEPEMKYRKLATSFTIGTFFVTGITGLLIFFELGTGGVRATHEWISIAFTVSAILHVAVHNRSFFKYFKEKMVILICFVLVLSGSLYYQSRNDIYAAEASYQVLINIRLSDLSMITGVDLQYITDVLADNGIELESHQVSIHDLSEKHMIDAHNLIEPILTHD